MTILNGSGLVTATPLDPHGTWHRNDYSDLHRAWVGPVEPLGGVQDGQGVFPRAWTPETDETGVTGEKTAAGES